MHLIDPRTQAALSPLYALDRTRNAEGLRRKIGKSDGNEKPSAPAGHSAGLPPLLQKLVAEHAASGLPPAYLVDPGDPREHPESEPTQIQPPIQPNDDPDPQGTFL